jgi:O-antigen/teichoic acid export membrane protein
LVDFTDGAKEFLQSVNVGIKLLLANLSGMLVLGIGPMIVEYLGGLESFAYYSLAVSLANVALIGISALSVVLYPVMKREPRDTYKKYFNQTVKIYRMFALALLAAYFPAGSFIKLGAMKFYPVLDFLHIIFGIVALQGKMLLVNNTYYRTLRLEREMLIANAASLLIVAVLSAALFMLAGSIKAIAYGTLLVMAIHVYGSQRFLMRHIGGVVDGKRMVMEVLILTLFLALAETVSLASGALGWTFTVASIAYLNFSELRATWHKILGLVP